jgi:hypothetical protein
MHHEENHHRNTGPWKIIGGILLSGIVVSILGAVFYWYEYRPSSIRRDSEAYANSQDAYDNAEANNFYRMCLLRNGMKPESMYVNTE